MSNFQYAPGLPGYGTQGADGSAGLIGLGQYFSEYNGNSDVIVLNNKILNNKILFSTDASLPGWPSRTYQVGETFVDKVGKVYKITIPSTGIFVDTEATLNASGLFISSISTTTQFNRYSNDYVIGKYLIDDVYATSGTTTYTTYPSDIYGFASKKYSKIKFSNYSANGINYTPFDVYTSGTNNNNSIAIVRDNISNIFRIGNLDGSENTRNTHIIFDASTVKISKDKGITFNTGTEDGTILTNHEIEGNYLFNPTFTYSPTSFTYTQGPTDVSILWNKADFLNTTDSATINAVKADLYFYKKDTFNDSSIAFNSTTETYKIVFDIDSSGTLKMKNLSATTDYGSFIRFTHNGWIRDSVRKIFTTGSGDGPVAAIDVSTGGIINISSDASTYRFDVSLNTGTWTAAANVTWISNFVPDSSSGTGWTLGTFDVAENILNSGRLGWISITSNTSTSPNQIKVAQEAAMASTYSVYFSTYYESPLTYISGNVKLYNSGDNLIDTKTILKTNVNGIPVEFANVPSGIDYYIDFSGMLGYIGGTIEPVFRYWGIDGITFGTLSNTTDTFTVNDIVSRHGKLVGELI